jgi:hypothetical protein
MVQIHRIIRCTITLTTLDSESRFPGLGSMTSMIGVVVALVGQSVGGQGAVGLWPHDWPQFGRSPAFLSYNDAMYVVLLVAALSLPCAHPTATALTAIQWLNCS